MQGRRRPIQVLRRELTDSKQCFIGLSLFLTKFKHCHGRLMDFKCNQIFQIKMHLIINGAHLKTTLYQLIIKFQEFVHYNHTP